MNIPVFLSRPDPFNAKQKKFIDNLISELEKRFLDCHTLGSSDYDPVEPLSAIRRLMASANGIITVAFGQTYIENATYKYGSEEKAVYKKEQKVNGQWDTSPYCQIETAMAFQLGLPIIILVEEGVREQGILEKGVIGTYLPSFSLDNADDYFAQADTQQVLKKWEAQVLHYYYNRGVPKN